MEIVVWLPVAALGIGAALWFVASRRKDRSSSPPVPKNRSSPAVHSLDRIPAGAMRRWQASIGRRAKRKVVGRAVNCVPR